MFGKRFRDVRRVRVLGTVLVLALLGGCASDPSADAEPVTPDAQWDAWVSQFLDGYYELIPSSGVSAGRHEFDGRIPQLDGTSLRQRIARLERFREQARAFPTAGLSRDRRLERDVAIWYLGRSIFWSTQTNWRTQNPSLLSGAISPTAYLNREYAPIEVRMAGLTRLLESTPRALGQIKAPLATVMPRPYLKRSIGYYGGLARHLATIVPATFDEAGTEAERARLYAATDSAIEALATFAAELAAREPFASEDYALGAETFAAMLAERELVTTSLPELEALGEADLARNYAQLVKVCTEELSAPDLTDCLALAEEGKSLDPVARGAEQLPLLKAFILEQDLLTIPGEEIALVREAPPHRRANLAYISTPGPFEQEVLPSIYFIAPPDPEWTEDEQRAFVPNEGRLLYVSAHEVWPGHFLNMLHRNRLERPLLRLFRSTTYSEGWAHYVEEMMHEAGLSNGDPRLHVGQLLNALKRNVRYLSAIGMHARGMTQAESEQMFLERALLDPGNARQQAARGTRDPSYLSYTLGKLQILALRDDWQAANPGAPLKAFHDELLSYGGAPLSLVRRYMLGDG